MLPKGAHLIARHQIALMQVFLFEERLQVAHECFRRGWRDLDRFPLHRTPAVQKQAIAIDDAGVQIRLRTADSCQPMPAANRSCGRSACHASDKVRRG
jgi:hypothetical protein